MNDYLLQLALSVDASPGTYGLLLGSGVSRAAGIPTGWEIVVDLIRKLARVKGEDPEPDPVSWYRSTFNEDPNYDKLLETLAGTPSERNALLRTYFEPTDEEREQGLKLPTPAHRALAQLIHDGYFRVVLTTNFDRLLEMALEEAGVSPDVISTDDALKGARPYVHSKCTIVKLHGDYRDTRIKNTEAELATYSPELNKYLDTILDEFGLIVCGWSAEWDSALRSAILRCPSRRYTTYWAHRGELTDEAKRLIRHRDAKTIQIESADSFFGELAQKLDALRSVSAAHPVSAEVAVATVKKLLAEDRFRIQLHDLLSEEVERVYTQISGPRFQVTAQGDVKALFQDRMRNYEAVTETLLNVVATLCWFDDGAHSDLVKRTLERLSAFPAASGYTVLIHLRLYPSLLLMYAAGIASLGSGHVNHLPLILVEPRLTSAYEGRVPILTKVYVPGVFGDAGRLVPRPNAAREYTPGSNHLFEVLRGPLKAYLPADDEYERVFDTFEFLLSLVYADQNASSSWMPMGCFSWRSSSHEALREFVQQGGREGNQWAVIKSGLFDSDPARFRSALEHFNDFVRGLKGRFPDERPPIDLLEVHDNAAQAAST